MSSSLSTLVDNLSEGLHNKNGENASLVCSIYQSKIIHKCIDYNKSYKLHFNKDLINTFGNTHEFCNKDINKFFLLLRKGIYPYEYMDSRERIDEKPLPIKEGFYSSLSMEGITYFDYRNPKIYI